MRNYAIDLFLSIVSILFLIFYIVSILNHKMFYIESLYLFIYNKFFLRLFHSYSGRFFHHNPSYAPYTLHQIYREHYLLIDYTVFIENQEEFEVIQGKYNKFFNIIYDEFLFFATSLRKTNLIVYAPPLLYIFIYYLIYLGASWYIFDTLYHQLCWDYSLLFLLFTFLSVLMLLRLYIVAQILIFERKRYFDYKIKKALSDSYISLENMRHHFNFTFNHEGKTFTYPEIINFSSDEGNEYYQEIQSHIRELVFFALATLTLTLFFSIQNIKVDAIYKNLQKVPHVNSIK